MPQARGLKKDPRRATFISKRMSGLIQKAWSGLPPASELQARRRRRSKEKRVMTNVLPVLPLRDIVVFPRMVAPLFVGRDKSVRALEEVEKGGGEILLVAQKEAGVDDPA